MAKRDYRQGSGMSIEINMDDVLDQVHKDELKRTFRLMKEDSDRNGVSIFVSKEQAAKLVGLARKYPLYAYWDALRLFQEYPDYKRIFPKFKFLTDGEMSNSKELKDHGDLVIQELDGIIGALDDPIMISVTLKRMARKHKKYAVKKHHITNILPEIIAVLKMCLNETSPTTEAAWSRLINYIGELVDRIKLEKDT